MNSALKPVLTPSGPQPAPVTSQPNKPMHPQSTPTTYGQPSSHMPPGLVNLPHNPNVAHSHPNPAHQPNHYSLNVPNAAQHYTNNPIPVSNHPVANMNPAANSGAQMYSQNKNVPFSGGYQPNLGHPPNQNPVPPVSQILPATQPPQPAPLPSEVPQSNGTAEAKSPAKPDEENHVAAKEAPPTPPKAAEKVADEATPAAEPSTPEPAPVPEEGKVNVPAPDAPEGGPSTATGAALPTDNVDQGAAGSSEHKADGENTETEGSEASDKEPLAESVESSNTEAAQNVAQPKVKEKEQQNQQKTPPVAKTVKPRTPTRKLKPPKTDSESPKTPKPEYKTPTQKSASTSGKSKRMRIPTQPYQSPLPEIEIITKISTSTPRSKNTDDKLIVFYKNEFLAVRNSEGSFYICQAVQNIYKSSPKIRIRWLSQDKNEKSGEVYAPDFYDHTDFDCILTNLNLVRVNKGKFRLPAAEKERTDSILKRSLAVEKGEVSSPSLTEEHPDGIDVSLYKEESQLKKRKGGKRKSSSVLKAENTDSEEKSPAEAKVSKLTKTPKKSIAASKVVETKRVAVASSSRMDRARRRSDSQNHKVSPVVEAKKTRAPAKVAKKATPAKSLPAAKNSKAPIASTSKVQKTPPKAVATRKTKRSRK